MRMGDLLPALRRAAVPAVAACAMAIAACGGDEQASGESASGESEVRQAFAEFEGDFHSGAAAEACARLTDRAVAELSKFAGTGDEPCVPLLTRLSKALGDIEQQPSKIVSVEVDGDQATAQVSDAGRDAVPVPFVRESGTWKIVKLNVGGGASP